MKVALITPFCYNKLYLNEINEHPENPDYFDEVILANHPDPVHKWCKMLHINNIDIEFWYLSSLQKELKIFTHKYGHKLRRIPGFEIKRYIPVPKRFNCDMSFRMLRELKKQKITHVLYLRYLLNMWLLVDFSDIIISFCKHNNIKIFPIYGGSSINRYKYKIKRKFKNYFLQKVDGLFCQSKSEINIMLNEYKFPSKKIHYFKNPLDLGNFYPIPKSDCFDYLNLNKNKRYILYVGRFEKSKGIHHLINIFPEIKSKYSNIALLIIGWGKYENELRKIANNLMLNNDIKIINFVKNDKLKYYCNIADVLVLPSYSEGTPNVLQEAIACNTICIGTNVGGIPDLLDDGVGLLIPPKDEKALYSTIHGVLKNGFEINQSKRKELLDEISLNNQSKRLKHILTTR